MSFMRNLTLTILLLMSLTEAFAACPPRMRGINLVPLPSGWYNGAVEMQFPTATQIAYYKSVGMNSIRLPIHWEDLQPILGNDLDARFIGHTVDFLDQAHAQGMKVLIDLHNYARYRNQLVGSPAVPASAFRDVWKRLAAALVNHPAVFAYGLMNEPHHTGGLWHTVAQSGVDGIREIDAVRPIYVDGDGWSNSQNWPKENPLPFVNDPSKPFLSWLTTHGQRGAIGETGVPQDDPRWLAALTKFLDMTDAACVDWFMWAGGGWRESYELSLEPINGKDRPQIKLLRSRL